MKKIISLLVVLSLVGCSSFSEAVKGNQDNYKEYVTLQLAQHKTIQECYKSAANKSECSVLAGSTNATQSLAGKPDQIRVPKAPSEVAESIIKDGLQGAVMIYGLKAVSSVIKTGLTSAGKVEVIRPEVIQPEPIFAYPLQ